MVEAQQPDETKKCRNCERDIEASKHRMHEVQCSRMNYKCKQCGEVVSKEDKEQHEAEAHAPIKCSFCTFSAQKHEFGRHEEMCEMKPKQCQFCQETFKVERFYEHTQQCGTQTKKCDVCGRFIMNKNREYHLTKGECQKNVQENERNKEREQQERLDELARFQEKENQRRDQEMKKVEEQKQRVPVPSAASVIKQPPTTLKSRVSVTNSKQAPVAVNVGVNYQPKKAPVIQNNKPGLAKPVPSKQRNPTPPRNNNIPAAVPNNEDMQMDDLDAAMIQQLMEEDMSLQAAEAFQNEQFGGAGSNNDAGNGMMGAGGNQNFGNPDEPQIRKADSTRIQQLVGGDDEEMSNVGEEMVYHTGNSWTMDEFQRQEMQRQKDDAEMEVPAQAPPLLRQSESQTQLAAAIAASMDPGAQVQGDAHMDEDEALARAIAESMQQ